MGGDRFTVFLLVALIAFAVLLVDERMLRAAIALLPALLLAQRATKVPSPSLASTLRPQGAEQRTDEEVRGHIEELLRHFREFYSTCHLVTTGSMAPDEAQERAAAIEKRLNRLLADVTDTAQAYK